MRTSAEATTQAQRVVVATQARRSDGASPRNAQSSKADAAFVDEEVRPPLSTRVVGGTRRGAPHARTLRLATRGSRSGSGSGGSKRAMVEAVDDFVDHGW